MRYADPTGEHPAVGLFARQIAGPIAIAGAGYLGYEWYVHPPAGIRSALSPNGPQCIFHRNRSGGGHGGGIGGFGNPPMSETGDRCTQEWSDAYEICDAQYRSLHPNPRITGGFDMQRCMKGLVSHKCGGNRPDYEHDPRKPKKFRPKKWRL